MVLESCSISLFLFLFLFCRSIWFVLQDIPNRPCVLICYTEERQWLARFTGRSALCSTLLSQGRCPLVCQCWTPLCTRLNFVAESHSKVVLAPSFFSRCLSHLYSLSLSVSLSPLQERPKSALERLYGSDTQQPEQPQPRGRMTAEEQLERMKRHQRALVRERKRNLSQGERHSNVSTSTSTTRPLTSDLPTSVRYPMPYPGRHRTHHQRDTAS